MKRLFSLLAVVLFAFISARGQENDPSAWAGMGQTLFVRPTAERSLLSHQAMDVRVDSASEKSPLLAFTLSAVCTGVPIGISLSRPDDRTSLPPILFFSGLVLGPAIGYFYADEWGRGFLGMGVRLGIGGLMFLAAGGMVGNSTSSLASAAVFGLIGIAFVFVDALYDLIDLPSVVSEHNALRRVFGLAFTPTYSLDTRATGIRICISL